MVIASPSLDFRRDGVAWFSLRERSGGRKALSTGSLRRIIAACGRFGYSKAMGKNDVPPSGGDDIQPVDLRTALEERYLAYALSTIMHRALPDVRDGLKPVHRRIVH